MKSLTFLSPDSLKPIQLTETFLVYGLMVLAFALYFVVLNHWVEYIFISLIMVWVIQRIRTGEFTWEKTCMDVPILAFLGWILLTIPFSTDTGYSFDEWRKSILRFCMFFFVVNVVKTSEQVRSILFSSSIGFGVLAVVETMNFFREGGHLFDLSSRAGFLTGSSQWLSNYLVIGIPVLLLGLYTENVAWSKLVYFCIIGVSLLALLAVNTRATWVALTIQLLMYFVMRLTKSGIRVGAFFLLSLGMLVMIVFYQGHAIRALFPHQVTDSGSLELRSNTWTFALDAITQHPITGIGYGKHSFQKAYPDLGKQYHRHIHNSFLSKAVQLGFLGGGLFLWIFWKVLNKSFRACHVFSGSYLEKYSVVISLITIGLIIRNLFDDMFIGTIAYLFWLFVGLFFALLNARGRQPDFQ